MKEREKNLREIVYDLIGQSSASLSLNFDALNSNQQKEIMRVYRLLGGCLTKPPMRFGQCDIVTKDFIIELDEEQHFNRYRKLTLGSTIYNGRHLFNHAQYKKYCNEKESLCLKKASHKGYWTNASTEKQFGHASGNGDFSGNGSPRWKQRAFYDFCKDFAGIIAKIPVFRLSIYDMLSDDGIDIELGTALEQIRIEAVIGYLRNAIPIPF